MSQLESPSNPAQDHHRPSICSEHHRIFPLCAELSKAASCLPYDTPDSIKRFCEIVLQNLPKDASGIKSFQIELFNSLLADLMPVTLEYKIDLSSVEPPMAQIRRVDDERHAKPSTDIDFSRIPLLEDLFDSPKTSAAPFDLTLNAVNTNSPSRDQPPFSCCFIPDDKVLGGSGKTIEVERNGKFNTRVSDEPIHDKGGIHTGAFIRDIRTDQIKSEDSETDNFPTISTTCSAHDESATSAPVVRAINVVPRTRPRSNTFVLAAPPQIPRTPVSSRYAGPPIPSSSAASSSTLSVSASLCSGAPSDVTINNDSAGSKEEKKQMMSAFDTDSQVHPSKVRETFSDAISAPKQAANIVIGEQSNKRSRDESPDSVDQELSHRPYKIRRMSNDGCGS
ncbi:uncharacterized protein EV420DRAFT_484543 [Desarmillaria tabescens]|uniref:Uncharacterized protein n=1 Tax=Armillaria tabescens TaxID=1929756 RepID=A0AA39KDJ1_ARMTA|nr:uncharacterized protein EV420DRAFT_484543 [Desarmillaria tabescens]KAK0457886.1 hypothetical protein EV420DRAFT_484543 [Desarmillaria tabescens]